MYRNFFSYTPEEVFPRLKSKNSNTKNLPHSDSTFVVISPRHRRKNCQHHLQKIQINVAKWIFQNVHNFEFHVAKFTMKLKLSTKTNPTEQGS